ncbi:MAG TPA: hemolysin family protein [Gemmatimonadales bacterium]|jgi:CBS domain containing-hemolysin-like protein|nr:hemolysin family protein [Gemmatimonadales bacterium]
MTETALTMLALAVAFTSAGLAGLLALAEEAPGIVHPGSDAAGAPGELPLRRAFQVARLALMIVAGVSAAQAIGWWIRPPLGAFWTALVAATFLFLLADALPRMVASLAPELSAALAGAARRGVSGVAPLLTLVAAVERAVRGILPAAAAAGEILGPAQRDILLGVFSLEDATVADIMTPRLDIVALDIETEWTDVVALLRESEHARIPVYAGTLDNLAGLLRAKDLVGSIAGVTPPPARWQDLIRPVPFVPESKTLAAQLRDFQRGRGELAIVVDEYGGTSGLVTMEDVLEEVVGEIHDEYDVDKAPAVERDGDTRFWVEGRITLDELSALLGVHLERDDVSTVGGLIYSELGRVPRAGEELTVAGFRVVVKEVERRRVQRVYFERLPVGAPLEPVKEGP